jgi:hypothetical protein
MGVPSAVESRGGNRGRVRKEPSEKLSRGSVYLSARMAQQPPDLGSLRVGVVDTAGSSRVIGASRLYWFCIWAIISAPRRAISSGETSSTWLDTFQR